MADTLDSWSLRQTGRQLVIELCQFVFLMRLVALVYIVFGNSLPQSSAEMVVLGASCVLALVGTYAMHRLVDTAPAHPLIVGIDVALASAGLFVSHAAPVFFVLSLFSALLTGLLYRGVSAVLLLSVLVLALLGASTAGSTELKPAEIAAESVLYVLIYFGGRVIAQRVEQLTAKSLAVGQQATLLQERTRIARDMHDGVVKTLHGIALSAEALGRSSGMPEEFRGRLTAFAGAAAFGVDQAREALVELRVDQDDRPFAVVVEDVVQRWGERTRHEVIVEVDGIADIHGGGRAEALSCLREALDNVAEHAEATDVSITLKADAARATLAVSDNGKGLDHKRLGAAARQGHFGVLGMQERMASVGGECQIVPTTGRGTTVRIVIPQPEPANRKQNFDEDRQGASSNGSEGDVSRE